MYGLSNRGRGMNYPALKTIKESDHLSQRDVLRPANNLTISCNDSNSNEDSKYSGKQVTAPVLPLNHMSPQISPASGHFLKATKSISFRSPRISPLNQRHLPAEFPIHRTKRNRMQETYVNQTHLQETIEEDKEENEKEPRWVRNSRFSEMRDYNEFNHGGKRYKSEEKINRNKAHRQNASLHPVTYVSETEEEDLHSDDDKAFGSRPKKLKVMTLAHLSSILNKKLFSDDFDRSSQNADHSQQR